MGNYFPPHFKEHYKDYDGLSNPQYYIFYIERLVNIAVNVVVFLVAYANTW